MTTLTEGTDMMTDETELEIPEDASEKLQLTREQKSEIRILVIDDEESLCESCGSVLEQEGYDVTICTRGREAEDVVNTGSFDIILLDLYMTGVPGTKLLEKALKVRSDALIIVMTGKPSVQSSIQALRDGAWDYIPKPFSAAHLLVLLGRAAHTVMVGRETDALRSELGDKHGHGEGVMLLGQSPLFRRVVDLARRVAPTDASVFISGESGTGKEMVARFIHENSRRSSRSLIPINCAAMPEPLLESEMFGHTEGAFTGAVKDKPGLMEAANGGTLFLDELTEMSTATQAKLLRVIQDGVVRRVGSNSTDAIVNVRFIAATNRVPSKSVESGTLREDLYYRLRVVPIHIPPLRERPEDIPLLARHFLLEFWQRHRANGPPSPGFSDDALRELQRRPWPGNVRELQNVVEHAIVLGNPGEEIQAEDLPTFDEAMANGAEVPYASLASNIAGEDYHTARDRILGTFERNYLSWILQEADGNMSEAARIAGVDRTTLYRLMSKHDLEKKHILTGQEKED